MTISIPVSFCDYYKQEDVPVFTKTKWQLSEKESSAFSFISECVKNTDCELPILKIQKAYKLIEEGQFEETIDCHKPDQYLKIMVTAYDSFFRKEVIYNMDWARRDSSPGERKEKLENNLQIVRSLVTRTEKLLKNYEETKKNYEQTNTQFAENISWTKYISDGVTGFFSECIRRANTPSNSRPTVRGA
jgi:hypothetical protein